MKNCKTTLLLEFGAEKKEKKRNELTYLESRAESNSFDSSVLFAMFFKSMVPWFPKMARFKLRTLGF